MGSRYTATSLGTTNMDSVVSVVDDLVSNRAIWRKACCIVLCAIFVLDAWAVVTIHVIHFTNQTVLEVTVSAVVLLVGQYLITGAVDGFIYWKRWKHTSQKVHSKSEEENKEAWICMRITLNLLGLAPISRYIDSLIVVKRMIQLEKQYTAEAISFAREFKQPSNLPTGSLLSAPVTSIHPSGSHKTNSNSTLDATRVRGLNAGLLKVQRVRRQFRRTERDAAYVALASGVAGAGPFLISQGVLMFRRIGLNFAMAQSTTLVIISCLVIGIVWLCAALTHFYPVSYEQTEVDYDRGIGQVPVGGLVLLFTTHLVNVTMRCGAFILFTGQFYPIVLAVIGFHFFCVWIMLLIARSCTKVDHSNPVTNEKSSISKNFLSDLMFACVGVFEFANAHAKFARTRYMIYYFFYYLENASMVGAWYVYFTYPEVWYYLPSLLVITIVQLLGFILFQVYLFLYSRPRRKTTLCGLCFAHKDLDAHTQFPPARVQSNELESNLRPYGLSQTGMSGIGMPASLISGQSGLNTEWNRATVSGICDPVSGQQIAQVAVPTTKRVRGKARQLHGSNARSLSVHSGINPAAPSMISSTHPPNERMYKQHNRGGMDRRYPMEANIPLEPSQSFSRLELEAEEVSKRHERSDHARGSKRPRQNRDFGDWHDHPCERRHSPIEHYQRSGQTSHHRKHSVQNGQYQPNADAERQTNKVAKGVFKPRPNDGRMRPQWPQVANPHR